MRILIQNVLTHQFLCADGRWSSDHELALEFTTATEAVEHCRRQRLDDYMIFVKFEESCHDFSFYPAHHLKPNSLHAELLNAGAHA